MAKEKEFVLKFTEEDLRNPEIKRLLDKLLRQKLNLQRTESHYVVFPIDLQAMVKLGGFVPVEKYKVIKYHGEIGKFNGKRVVIFDKGKEDELSTKDSGTK